MFDELSSRFEDAVKGLRGEAKISENNISDFKNLEFIDNPLNCQNQEQNIISNTLDELKNINLGVKLNSKMLISTIKKKNIS